MADPTADPRDERPGTHHVDASTQRDPPEIACTLTAEQTARRREWIETNLLPHLETIAKQNNGFSFVFDRNPDAYVIVTELSWKESHCCAWATFGVELPPDGESIRWNVRSEREGGLEFFDEALQETLQTFEDAPSIA